MSIVKFKKIKASQTKEAFESKIKYNYAQNHFNFFKSAYSYDGKNLFIFNKEKAGAHNGNAKES